MIREIIGLFSLKENPNVHPASLAVGILCLGLLAWRLLKFTIRPALHPDAPKEYPYWIPGKPIHAARRPSCRS
jgi:hypothetical protein